MKRVVKKVRSFLTNLIFPIYCLGCGREKSYLCLNCLEKIPLVDRFTCPKCQRPSLGGKVCQGCQKKTYLAGLIYPFSYKESLIREAIHILKYERVYPLVNPLARIFVKLIKNSDFFAINFSYPLTNFVIIPIPLFRRKFLERGFNQAELIAQEIAKNFNLPLKNNLLIKIKNTFSQTDLKKKDRLYNVKDSFIVKNKKEIKGKIVLLIDDVFTTGATLEEAAKTLKKAGAKEIWGLVIARG